MTASRDFKKRKALERISKLEVDLFDGKYGGKGQAVRALEDAVYWACEALDVPKVELLREEGGGISILRACPFCGDKPSAYWGCGCITDGEPCGDKLGHILRAVQCDCGAEMTTTIEAWNRRS